MKNWIIVIIFVGFWRRNYWARQYNWWTCCFLQGYSGGHADDILIHQYVRNTSRPGNVIIQYIMSPDYCIYSFCHCMMYRRESNCLFLSLYVQGKAVKGITDFYPCIIGGWGLESNRLFLSLHDGPSLVCICLFLLLRQGRSQKSNCLFLSLQGGMLAPKVKFLCYFMMKNHGSNSNCLFLSFCNRFFLSLCHGSKASCMMKGNLLKCWYSLHQSNQKTLSLSGYATLVYVSAPHTWIPQSCHF